MKQPWKPGDPCALCEKPVVPAEKARNERAHAACVKARRDARLKEHNKYARKKAARARFRPGMPCPGLPGAPCGKALDQREDLHPGRVLCGACGTEENRMYQQQLRAAAEHKCADCPAMCGSNAERCRKCGQAKARREALATLRQVPVVRRVADWCPAGRSEDLANDAAWYDPARVAAVDAIVARVRGRG